jgi:hypothetical protein
MLQICISYQQRRLWPVEKLSYERVRSFEAAPPILIRGCFDLTFRKTKGATVSRPCEK